MADRYRKKAIRLFETPEVYPLNNLSDIMEWCQESGRAYWEYVEQCEGPGIWEYLREVWKTMREAVERGLDSEGVLPGPLGLSRRAARLQCARLGL